MSSPSDVACARVLCGKLVGLMRALWLNGLPYCSKFCFSRASQAAASDVPLQENRP